MYKNILVGLDGSDLSLKGLNHALTLAQSVGAAVTAVTVTEKWSSIEMAESVNAGNPFERYEAAASASARAILDQAAKIIEARGIACKTVHVADQHPAEGMIATARHEGCDLIVMTSHGRRGMRRLILGSQTFEVVTQSNIPVLVVR